MKLIGQSMHPNYVGGNLELLDAELTQIKQAGADSCELILQGLDIVIGSKIIPSREKAVLDILQKHDLAYSMHMPHGLNLLDAGLIEMNVDVFRASIDFAKKASIKVINFHAGRVKSDDKNLILKEIAFVKLLSSLAPDIMFCMENPPISVGNTEELTVAASIDEMISFCKRIDMPNFKLTYDVGHGFLNHKGNKKALLEDMVSVLPYTGHIHLHDNCGIYMDMREAGPGNRLVNGIGDIHLPLGWGSIPLDDVFGILKDYDGIINLEIEERFSYSYSDCIALVREKLA